jgi:hypothetical protein
MDLCDAELVVHSDAPDEATRSNAIRAVSRDDREPVVVGATLAQPERSFNGGDSGLVAREESAKRDLPAVRQIGDAVAKGRRHKHQPEPIRDVSVENVRKRIRFCCSVRSIGPPSWSVSSRIRHKTSSHSITFRL